MAGATCGAGYAHSSGTPDITPVFYGVHVVFFTCVCVFNFIPYVVGPDSILFLRMNGITIWNVYCRARLVS